MIVEAIVSVGPRWRSLPWRTSSPMPYESISASSDVSLALFGLRIIRAIQPSAARGRIAECVAKQSRGAGAGRPLLRRRLDRELGDVGPSKAVVRGDGGRS